MKRRKEKILMIVFVCFLTFVGCEGKGNKTASVDEPAVALEGVEEDDENVFEFLDVHGQQYQAELIEEVPKQGVDYSLLKSQGQMRYLTDEEGNKVSSFGIDVSKYQGEIDWKKVKDAGVEFAIIRLGFRGYGQEGNLVLDEYYHANMSAAIEAGIEVGVYFFSQAVSREEAKEEAHFVLEHIKDYALAYPVVFDTEKIEVEGARTESVSPEIFTDCCIAFCDEILKNGYETMIYYNMLWSAFSLELERLVDYEKWYADYYEIPQCPYEFQIWQYSETGTIDGIEGHVDLNIKF